MVLITTDIMINRSIFKNVKVKQWIYIFPEQGVQFKVLQLSVVNLPSISALSLPLCLYPHSDTLFFSMFFIFTHPQDNFGYDLPAVEAAMKKHEAIEADIASYEERIGVVVELSAEMEAEGYYDIRRILARKENILGQWSLLKELVAGRRTRLEKNLALQKTFQDMVYMIDWMEDTQVLEREN